MNKQRKVLITITYNEMGIIIDKKAEEVAHVRDIDVPIKRGRWVIKAINTFKLSSGITAYEPVYECSVCGGMEESYLRFDEPIMPEDASFPRYCPNCGAKMEEEE